MNAELFKSKNNDLYQNQLVTLRDQERQMAVERVEKYGQSLTSTAKEVILASQAGQRIGEVAPSQITSLFEEIISLLDIKVHPDDEIDFVKNLKHLRDWVIKYYADHTIEEVRLAYNWAIIGKTNVRTFRELIPVSFGEIMKAYFSAVRHDYQEGMKELSRMESKTSQGSNGEEIRALFIGSFAEAIQETFKGLTFKDPGNFVYDHLDQHKLVPYDALEKRAFIEQAGKELVSETRLKIGNTLKKEEKDKLEEFISSLYTEAGNGALIDRAKRIALRCLISSWGKDESLRILDTFQHDSEGTSRAAQ